MMNMIPYYTARTLRTRPAVLPFADDFFRSFFAETTAPTMRVDVEDKGDSYLLTADLPGLKREDVRISVEDGVLTIAAEYNTEQTEEDKNRRYLCRERRFQSLRRSFSTEGIDEMGISAQYIDGVLHLTLPKLTEQKSGARQIEIA